MGRTQTFLGGVLLLVAMFNPLRGQEIEAGNRIKVLIRPSLVRTSSQTLQYAYQVTNHRDSRQKVWQFYVMTAVPARYVEKIHSAEHWGAGMPQEDSIASVRWGTATDYDIVPGESRGGFSFESPSPPGIVDYYAEGYHNPPSFPEGMAPDSIPGYDDLTPYGPGIVGKTVGPVLPPDPFVTRDFLDTLASYKHQAAALGWVGQDVFLNQLDEKLDQARDQLAKGHTKQAIDKVQEFLKKIEHEAKKTEKDQDKKNDKKWVTSEGYALLKFNAEYLIEKLEEQITKKK